MSKYGHLKAAPKNLLDVSYCLAVAKGEILPSEYSLTAVWTDKFVPAEEITDAETAYGHGYSQGWEAEMGGRAFLATPPVGLEVRLLPAFCEGVLAGSGNVKTARMMSGYEADSSFDPFSDI